MQINYPVEAEILSVQPKAKFGESNVIRYTCRATLHNGSQIIIPNVEAPTFLGGIADYAVFRHRASLEADDMNKTPMEQTERDAAIGDRCIIVFINGQLMRPKIVAFMQHPNQTPEITDPDEKKPQGVFQYLGIRTEFTENGDLRVIHKGLPTIKYDPDNSTLLDSDVLGKTQAAQAKAGGNSIGGDNNGQIEPADQSEITLFEMLEKGIYRIRDAEGQSLEIDPDKKTILLSNDYYPSWLSLDAPQASSITGKDAEYLLMDKSDGSLTIQSTKLTKIISKQDFEQETAGKHQESCDGDYEVQIKGNEKKQVTGKMIYETSDSFALESNKTVEISGKSEVAMKDGSGATFKAANGKIALGSTSAELVDILSKLLQQLSIETYSGFGAPATGAAKYLELKTLLDTIKGTL